ncbi:MAG TPA: histidine triad nucleotide-binding protein [Chloroflexota bacterium]|jgi:histidine triad (HIT) family protein|nr:histidine triad nucleotide-binding protein [Chloroflexota bacterium]
MSDCVFCKIARGEIPAQIVYQDGQVTAFEDADPKAPVHVLVVPNQHVGSAAELGPGNGPLLAAMVLAANRAAEAAGVAGSGYRLVMNVGQDAGMSVPHLHLHVLGGRALAWPPG